MDYAVCHFISQNISANDTEPNQRGGRLFTEGRSQADCRWDPWLPVLNTHIKRHPSAEGASRAPPDCSLSTRIPESQETSVSSAGYGPRRQGLSCTRTSNLFKQR